jgi:GH25 family lysozyme M1 (1,4-beta-N-acetylmuramidase)
VIVDVSRHQGTIDWPRLKAAGVTCAIIRVTTGTRIDSEFRRNWAEAHRAGIERIGWYAYFVTETPPLAQASAVLEITGGDCGNEPLTVDCERRADERLLPFDKAAYTANVKAFLDELAEALPHVRQRIYTSAVEWHTITTQPEWARDSKYSKWLAQYNTRINAPDTPPGWRWDRWQYTSVGRVDGIDGNVDLNRDAVELPHLDPAPVESEANVQYLLTTYEPTARVLELLGSAAVELQAVVPIQIPSIPPPPLPQPFPTQVTNRWVINLFSRAFGPAEYWGKLALATDEMKLVANRDVIYDGPSIPDMPGLSANDKTKLFDVLALL